MLVLLNLAFAATLLSSDDLVADESVQRVARIGFVSHGSASAYESYFTAFQEELTKLGYVEGRNLVIEVRWADGHSDRLPALMAEVVEHKIDVIVTSATAGAIAARNATSTIPIVAAAMADPVRTGLAKSLARPGGNVTGMSMGYSEEISGKWLELLQDTVPRLELSR
jgi:putative ABC transport system substrate-binding protein